MKKGTEWNAAYLSRNSRHCEERSNLLMAE